MQHRNHPLEVACHLLAIGNRALRVMVFGTWMEWMKLSVILLDFQHLQSLHFIHSL
jgi:hypothetical protein